jgi:hypothetical protein
MGYALGVDFRQAVEAIIPDAQGRILATLARTTQEISLSTLAELSGVSLAHVARIVPRLVELGIVARHDVPPAVLVKLVPEHLASRAILMLAGSDVDVIVVRPSSIDEDNSTWAESIARWETHVRRISGNAVNRIEVGEDEAAKLMKSRRSLWQAIRREGIVLQGRPLADVRVATRA